MNLEATKRIVANEGGTGSSKSYSLAQLFVLMGLQQNGKTLSICRNSLPTLRASAMRDFMNVLNKYGIYHEQDHDKTNNTYRLNGNVFEFFGLDEPQKVRSRRRDYLWINEANEASLEAWRQLSLRTNTRIYLDYNPSDLFHWIYDEVLPREDCQIIRSTYKDNPFLPSEIVKEIEGYKDKDQNYWRIYGQGIRGVSEVTIFTHWKLIDALPDVGDEFYGLDFGFNHPSCLVKIKLHDNNIYVKEMLYESHLTNQELISRLKSMDIGDKYIYADPEDPARIEEIKRAGFNILPADKGPGSVRKGIDEIKARAFYITKDSVNGIKELKTYSWKTKDGKPLDEPVKAKDDFCDATRMGVFSSVGSTVLGEDAFLF